MSTQVTPEVKLPKGLAPDASADSVRFMDVPAIEVAAVLCAWLCASLSALRLLAGAQMARQLTLIDFDLYKSIKPEECVNKSWSKSESEAPHIIAMARRYGCTAPLLLLLLLLRLLVQRSMLCCCRFVRRFNMVSRWVASEIVKAGVKLKERVATMKRFIEIGA